MSSESPLAPMLRKLTQSSPLGAADREAILALPHKLRQFAPGSYIVREGDAATHACVLLSGYAYRHKVVGDGGRQVLALHMKGDVVDLQNSFLKAADHNVQTITKAEVALIPREAVREIAFARPAIGMAMWHDTLVDGSVHREWTANVGRRDARTRMAHLLCEFGVRLDQAGLGTLCDYDLPMTQEQIADATGLTSVHVNRTLMALDREGWTRRNMRSVHIRDWDQLAGVGDFDPAYLHLTPKPLAA